MTDKEIKELATAYAEYACPESSYDDDIVERNMDLRIAKDEAEPVIKWLSERFCIVEKEKVRDLIKEVNLYADVTTAFALNVGGAKIFGADLFTDKDENHAD